MSLFDWLWRLLDKPVDHSPRIAAPFDRHLHETDALTPPPPVRRLPIRDVGGMSWSKDDDD